MLMASAGRARRVVSCLQDDRVDGFEWAVLPGHVAKVLGHLGLKRLLDQTGGELFEGAVLAIKSSGLP